jgi:hypothetical protein
MADSQTIESGFCHCGCGQKTKIVNGLPNKFLYEHRGIKPDRSGYRKKYGSHGSLFHRWRAAEALGKPLAAGSVVHHVDGTKGDNSPLVICQDDAYHVELHRKLRVIAAGGNPWTDRICCICHTPKSTLNFWIRSERSSRAGQFTAACKPCSNAKNAADIRRRRLEGHPRSDRKGKK